MPAARTFSSFHIGPPVSPILFLFLSSSSLLSPPSPSVPLSRPLLPPLLLLLHRAVALSLLPLMLARSSTIARQREMTPPNWGLR